MRGAALALALAVLAPGCSERGAPPATGPPRLTTVQGTLVAQSLPDEGDAIVELRDATSTDGPIVAEQRIALRGAQPPIRFALTVDPGRLRADATYTVRGAIQEKGLAADLAERLPPGRSHDGVGRSGRAHREDPRDVDVRHDVALRRPRRDPALRRLRRHDARHGRRRIGSAAAGGRRPGRPRDEAPNDRTTRFTITGATAPCSSSGARPGRSASR